MPWYSRIAYSDQKEWTYNDVDVQQVECQKRYDNWQQCLRKKGARDQGCKKECLEDYYTCIDKLNAMRSHFEVNLSKKLNRIA
ncbi:unnamed protein product [Blepharisma stoltei]|uniref:Uncharacterized protein n=1 Tax=Blepharisma stoltei TaxID=1481888 RepID=A0AAU9KBJ1_9CILI|nr:unnamed protein product [Blepharisma stoltei]